MYDYLVVGSGLFGSVFARQAADAGKKVFVNRQAPKHCRKCVDREGGRHQFPQIWGTHFSHQ